MGYKKFLTEPGNAVSVRCQQFICSFSKKVTILKPDLIVWAMEPWCGPLSPLPLHCCIRPWLGHVPTQ